MRTPTDLIQQLQTALRAQGYGAWADMPLEPLRDKGLAHDHVRLTGSGALARIPKQSQLGLDAEANLLYQRACFERAEASGHTPRLLGVLHPSEGLPRGALLVEEILGRTAVLPDDLPRIATALAGLHRLNMPPAAHRQPLQQDADPLASLAEEIDVQAGYLTAANLERKALTLVQAEISGLRHHCSAAGRPARSLIAFDAHPGNFIIRSDDRAVLVDLEKCRYSYPGLDLAHATLYTSTTWDVDSCAVLSTSDVLRFHEAWAQSAGPIAEAAQHWHALLRRAMWLWSVTWCAKWRVLSTEAARDAGQGEDWSAERSDTALVAHVRNRVDHYLEATTVARIIDGFDEFESALAG